MQEAKKQERGYIEGIKLVVIIIVVPTKKRIAVYTKIYVRLLIDLICRMVVRMFIFVLRLIDCCEVGFYMYKPTRYVHVSVVLSALGMSIIIVIIDR